MDKTRRSWKCPLFGDTGEIKTNVLPTYEEVMRFYAWTRYRLKSLQEKPKEPSFSEIAEIVVSKIEEIWKIASIPTVSRTRIIQMLKAYHLKCKNLEKSLKRLTEDKLASFRQTSRVLFDIASCKCKNFQSCICSKEKKVPKSEQVFLTDQRSSRQMMIGGVDIAVTRTLKKRLQRKRQLDKPSISSTTTTTDDLSDAMSSSSDSVNNDEFIQKSKLDQPKSSSKRLKLLQTQLPTVSKICDRYGVSDRAAAAIVSSVLHDIKSDVSVVDRHKLRRERIKTREKVLKQNCVSDIPALYFDGRKDKTVSVFKKHGRNYKKTFVEEHISLVKEPGSIYLSYVVPATGSAKDIEASINNFFSTENKSMENLIAIGCDGTNVNTGKFGGIIRLLEKRLKKPLQWIICMLHMNELPLRHLFLHLDGSTSGPKSYTGTIGKALENCEGLPITSFQKIEGSLLPITSDLSTDQLYLHRIVTAVISGCVPDDLAQKSPGKLSHARWLTRANRILRLYVATKNPDENLIVLATFVVKVYAPTWFEIKNHPSCKDGARHLFKLILSSRYLPENLKKIVDVVIQRNSYFAHHENMLLSMLTDERKHVRELAARRVLKARSINASSTVPRLFEVPKIINFDASEYINLIDWQCEITEPPLLKYLTESEIRSFIDTGEGNLDFLRLPCHTQAVERAVKITTEAANTLCTRDARIGLIKSKLESRAIMPKFETKKDFKVE